MASRRTGSPGAERGIEGTVATFYLTTFKETLVVDDVVSYGWYYKPPERGGGRPAVAVRLRRPSRLSAVSSSFVNRPTRTDETARRAPHHPRPRAGPSVPAPTICPQNGCLLRVLSAGAAEGEASRREGRDGWTLTVRSVCFASSCLKSEEKPKNGSPRNVSSPTNVSSGGRAREARVFA